MKKGLGVGIVIIISFIAGYYSSYFAVEERIKEVQVVADIISSGLKESDKRRWNDKKIEELNVDSQYLTSLISIQQSGKPIELAIKDAVERLEITISDTSKNIDVLGSEDEKRRVKEKIVKIKQLLEEARFYYIK